MDIRCPYCLERGNFTAIHRHMTDVHRDRITTQREAETNKMEYLVACPFCEEMYRRQVNPRSRNPRFLEEFKAEIALVAFDQMLYHILEKHAADIGVDPAELGI